MSYVLKTFKCDTTVNQRFKEECIKKNIRQGDVLEALMIRWIKLKTDQEKREVIIYKD